MIDHLEPTVIFEMKSDLFSFNVESENTSDYCYYRQSSGESSIIVRNTTYLNPGSVLINQVILKTEAKFECICEHTLLLIWQRNWFYKDVVRGLDPTKLSLNNNRWFSRNTSVLPISNV